MLGGMTRGILALLMLLAGVLSGQQESGGWRPIFDGKSLAGWKETAFTGHSSATVQEGAVVLKAGAPMTGITAVAFGPRSNYEIRFDAMRQLGGDFFASVTFPVKDSFCTFVTGGWGGDIVGISSIDGWDASDNETRSYFTFENGKWYGFRVQVTDNRIRAWIDEKPIVNVGIEGRAISLRRGEMNLNIPLGFASYNTTGVLRKVEYRMLPGAKPDGQQSRSDQR